MLLKRFRVELDVSSYTKIKNEAGDLPVGGLMLNQEGHRWDSVLSFLVGRRDEETFGQGEMTRTEGMNACCCHDSGSYFHGPVAYRRSVGKDSQNTHNVAASHSENKCLSRTSSFRCSDSTPRTSASEWDSCFLV